MNIQFKSAIFDLDGTLLNSTHVWSKVDDIFLHKRNINVPDDYIDNIAHKSLNECAVYTKERFNLEDSVESIIEEWHELTMNEYMFNISLKDNVIDFLEILKKNNIKMGIATGLPHKLFEPALKRLGIDKYFLAKVSVDDVKRGKAFPDVYIHTAKLLNTNIDECIVFEDVLAAIETVKNANIKVCAVFDKGSESKTEQIKQIADYYINSWEELL